MEVTIDAAVQSALSETFADILDDFFMEDEISGWDVMDCLATGGLGLTVSEAGTPPEVIELFCHELDMCGHYAGTTPEFDDDEKPIEGTYVDASLEDAVIEALSIAKMALAPFTVSNAASEAYVAEILAASNNN
jgi:hypothetical protein